MRFPLNLRPKYIKANSLRYTVNILLILTLALQPVGYASPEVLDGKVQEQTEDAKKKTRSKLIKRVSIASSLLLTAMVAYYIKRAFQKPKEIPDDAPINSTIFFTANELHADKILETLKAIYDKAHSHQKTCHIGVASLYNWAIATRTKPENIYMIDYDPAVVGFNKMALDTLKESGNAQEFTRALALKITSSKKWQTAAYEGRFYQDGNAVAFRKEALQPIGLRELHSVFQKAFLGKAGIFHAPDSFAYLKQKAVSGAIIIRNTDLSEPASMQGLSKEIKQSGLSIDTIYLSNVADWIHWQAIEKQASFRTGLDLLASDTTLLIKGVSATFSRGLDYDISLHIFHKDEEVPVH